MISHYKVPILSFESPSRVCLLPDERSERKCTQNGDTFAELNPSFCENCVFQVSMKHDVLKTKVENSFSAINKYIM